jgi:hypothetical protein
MKKVPKIEVILKDPNFDRSVLKGISVAVFAISEWVRAVEETY